jgi:hypothetical protein
MAYNTYIMEMFQGKTLYSYLKQKCLVFFSKMENREAKQVLSGGWYLWEGGGRKEEGRRVNMVEMLCIHV